jgi:predicted nucleic acid-binding protein
LSDILVDTNVLVYSFDPRDGVKQAQARSIIGTLIGSGGAVLSVQCLTEFFRIVRWRLPEPLSPEDALLEVARFSQACPVHNLTLPAALEAFRGSNDYQMHIWDALIWAVAKVNRIPFVLTEDAEHGRLLEGVQYLNPFHPEFDLDALRV